MNKLDKRVLRLIPTGKERPRPAKEIAEAVQVNERTVNDIVARLIIQYRVPIIGDRGANNGYYIPRNEVERLEGLQALEHQTRQQEKRLNVVTYCSLTEWKELLESEVQA